jgi:uncharacterized membrane protein
MASSTTENRDPAYVKIGDAYFRRLLVPIVITMLIFAAAVAIIVVPPGTPSAVSWSSFASGLGAKAFSGTS